MMRRYATQGQKKAIGTIHVGLIGLGTVGTGVAKMLNNKRDLLRQKSGFDFVLKRVCVRHPKKPRGIRTGNYRITRDPRDILEDPDIDQVVELIGGLHPAERIIRWALQNGKDVISANKALFAEKGLDLYRLSRRTGSHIGIEAAVCGGLPILKAIREGLQVNQILELYGILNGTSNSILTAMTDKKATYAEALAQAQAKGIAEKEPSMDVGGIDTAHKLAILARAAFQREIDLKKIHVEGIQHISPVDIDFAKSMGYTIKLLGIAKRDGPRLELRVHPTLLHRHHLLANVNDINNGVVVRGSEVGEILFYGEGAGQKPTASAVISDMMDIAKKSVSGVPSDEAIYYPAQVKEFSDLVSRYYIRLEVKNRTGAMARLTEVLGRKGISIASVHQQEIGQVPSVPVVILTHRATEKNISDAVKKMSASRFVTRRITVIRVEDNHGR